MARVSYKVVDRDKKAFNEEALNHRGESFTKFCALNELRIKSTFYKIKP